MVAKSGRTLVLALRGSLLCCLYMEGVQLEDWRASRKASKSAGNAVSALRIWLETYQPDCIITENADMAQRKGNKKRAILMALAQVAADHEALNVEVIRQQHHANMYEEAAVLEAGGGLTKTMLTQHLPDNGRSILHIGPCNTFFSSGWNRASNGLVSILGS